MNNFFRLAVDLLKNLRYTLRMTVERDREEEARKAEARAQRWNESVQRVRDLAQAWQRDNRRWQSEAANRERWERENGRNLSG